MPLALTGGRALTPSHHFTETLGEAQGTTSGLQAQGFQAEMMSWAFLALLLFTLLSAGLSTTLCP